MPTLTPTSGKPGQTLKITVTGLPADLWPIPFFLFHPPGPGTGYISKGYFDVKKGSIHKIKPGTYELEVTILPSAPEGQHVVTVVNKLGNQIQIGNFTVRSLLITKPLSIPYSSMVSGIPATTTKPAAQTSTSSSPAPGSVEAKISEAKIKILKSEAKFFEELAKAAPQQIGKTEWLRAAAEKECCAAQLVNALAGKDKKSVQTTITQPQAVSPTAALTQSYTFQASGKTGPTGIPQFGFQIGSVSYTIPVPAGTTATAAIQQLSQFLSASGLHVAVQGNTITVKATLPPRVLTGSGLVVLDQTSVDVDDDLGKTPFEIGSCDCLKNGSPSDGPIPVINQLLLRTPEILVAGQPQEIELSASLDGTPVGQVPLLVNVVDPETGAKIDDLSCLNGMPALTEGGDAGVVIWTGEEGLGTAFIQFENQGDYQINCSLFEGQINFELNTRPYIAGIPSTIVAISTTVVSVAPNPQKALGCSNYFNPEMDGLNDEVNVASGTLNFKKILYQIPGRGNNIFRLILTYSSDLKRQGVLGPNWDHNHNKRLQKPLTIHNGFGDALVHGNEIIPKNPKSPTGDFSVVYLQNIDPTNPKSDLIAIRRFPGGLQEKFHYQSGLLIESQDTKGNKTRYFYEKIGGKCVLKTIVDSMGRRVANFTYGMFESNDRTGKNNTQIIAVTDHTGRQIKLNYNETEQQDGGISTLSSITSFKATSTPDNTFPNGKTTIYKYLSLPPSKQNPNASLRNNLIAIINPNEVEDGSLEPSETIEWGMLPSDRAFDRVKRQIGNNGQTTREINFIYDYKGPSTQNLCTDKIVTVIDPEKHKRVYYFTIDGFKEKFEEYTGLYDSEGNLSAPPIRGGTPEIFTSLFDYTKDGQVKKVTNPEDDSIEYEHEKLGGQDPLFERLNSNNLIKKTRRPGPRKGDQNEITEEWVYDHYFQGIILHRKAGRFELGATRDLEFEEKTIYDWQKIIEQGEPASKYPGVEIRTPQTGDLSFKDFIRGGNPVEVTTKVYRGQNPLQEIITRKDYNKFGQVIRSVDPEGNHTTYEYYPEINPGGAVVTSPVPNITLDHTTGGYLKTLMVDHEHEPDANLPSQDLNYPFSTAAPSRKRTDFLYDSRGNKIKEINPRGVVTITEFNEMDQVTAVHEGIEIDPFRSELGLSPVSAVTKRIFYDANGRQVQNNLTSNRDILSYLGLSPFPFDHTGSIAEWKEYNRENQLTAVTRLRDDQGFVREETYYNRNNKVIEVRSGVVTSGEDPENRILTRYDERGLVYETIQGGESDKKSISRFYYDKSRNKIRCEDGEGNSTYFFYDGYNRLIKEIDPTGLETLTGYDAAGNILSIKKIGIPKDTRERPALAPDLSNLFEALKGNVLLSSEETEYDELNRAIKTKEKYFTVLPDGTSNPINRSGSKNDVVVSKTSYDRNNRVLYTEDDNKHRTYFVYDGADREVLVEDPMGNVQEKEFDANDNLILVRDREVYSVDVTKSREIFTEKNSYDALDRVIKNTNNIGNIRETIYDNLGNIVRKIDAEGNVNEFKYDALLRKIKTVTILSEDGTGLTPLDLSQGGNGKQTIQYEYNDNDNLRKIIDDNGNATAFAYDALNRIEIETYADGTEVVLKYDKNNNIIEKLDANETKIGNKYDRRGWEVETEITYPTTGSNPEYLGGTRKKTRVFDSLGREIEATDETDDSNETAKVISQYDSLDNQIEETQGLGVGKNEKMMREYDGEGNEVLRKYFIGQQSTPALQLKYKYDAVNRITTIKKGQQEICSIQYIGERVDKLVHREKGPEIDLSYDRNRRVVRYLVTSPTTGDILDYVYTYDMEDNQTSECVRHMGEKGRAYKYDSAYQLIRSEKGKILSGHVAGASKKKIYSFDGVGNRKEVRDDQDTNKYTINSVNEYTNIDGQQLKYDKNGNLIEDKKFKYRYDFLNRLVQVTDMASGNIIGSYRYDAKGRRVRSISVVNGNTLTMRYLYADEDILEERIEGTQKKKVFIHHDEIDMPLELHVDNDIYIYHYNNQKNIVAISDKNGDVIERYEYEDYGKVRYLESDGITEKSLSSIENRYLFTGRELDPETGIYYFRARHYSPDSGRFIQRDPLGIADQINPYTYVGNNPHTRLDPSGMGGYGIGEWLSDLWNNAPGIRSASISGAKEGAKGGGSILVNEFTGGISDKMGITNSEQYQGAAYDVARVTATISKEALITAGTFGQGQTLRAIAKGADYVDFAASTVAVGEGLSQIAEGDTRAGLVKAGLGAFSLGASSARFSHRLNKTDRIPRKRMNPKEPVLLSKRRPDGSITWEPSHTLTRREAKHLEGRRKALKRLEEIRKERAKKLNEVYTPWDESSFRRRVAEDSGGFWQAPPLGFDSSTLPHPPPGSLPDLPLPGQGFGLNPGG